MQLWNMSLLSNRGLLIWQPGIKTNGADDFPNPESYLMW